MRVTRRYLAALGSTAAILAFGLGCSTDSPTAPTQSPGAPPGTSAPSATWNISVSISPNELTINEGQPATVSVLVRRADNGRVPASGTSIVVSTSLGDFSSSGSGQSSVPLQTVNGRASALLFAGSIAGTALVSAQLEASVGQKTVAIRELVEPVVAAFSSQNSENDRSVQFLNQSTGDPTEFLWDFGDGTTSTEENPTHIFPSFGDFVVTLTASKQGASDTASSLIAVGSLEELRADFDFINTESNLSVKFLNISTGNPTSFTWDFGDGSTSREENPDHVFGLAGDYVVTLTARNSLATDTISKIVTVGQPLELFVNFVSPNFGSPSGGTLVTINGNGFRAPLAVTFGTSFGDVLSVTLTEIQVRTPPGVLQQEVCDSDGNDIDDGLRTLDTTVPIGIELESGPSTTLPAAFTYASPTGDTCVPNP